MANFWNKAYDWVFENVFPVNKDDLRIGLTNSLGKDYFSMTDYKWSAKQEELKDKSYSTPKLIIREFQPQIALDTGAFIDAGISLAGGSGFVDTILGSKPIETITKGLTDSSLVAPRPDDKYMREYVKKMFKTIDIRTYEVPFFKGSYLTADTTDKWSYAGASLSQGSKIAELKQKLANADFPNTPIWSMNVADLGAPLDVDFYLINDSIEDFDNNMKFLLSLVSGCYWLSATFKGEATLAALAGSTFVQKSPNVYRVECPGRFIKYWCAMGCSATYVGKFRRVDGSSLLLNNITGGKGPPMFPEAFMVRLSIKDMTPNNFNVLLNYYKGTQ